MLISHPLTAGIGSPSLNLRTNHSPKTSARFLLFSFKFILWFTLQTSSYSSILLGMLIFTIITATNAQNIPSPW